MLARRFSEARRCLTALVSQAYATLYRDIPNVSLPQTFTFPEVEAASDPLFSRLKSTYENPKDLANLLKVVKTGKQLQPDHIKYTMKKLAEHTEIEELQSLIDLWNFKGFAKDVVPYNYLLASYFQLPDLEKGAFQALELWKEIQSKGIAPNAESYEALIFGLSKAGHHDQALNLFNEMRQKQIKPSRDTFKIILYHLTHALRNDEAVAAYNALKADYGEADAVATRILITGYAHKGDVENVLSLLNQGTPTPELWSLFIDAHTQSSASEDVLIQLKQKFYDLGILRDVNVLSGFLNFYGRVGDTENAFAVLDVFKNEGLVPLAYAYKSLLSHLSKKGDVKRAKALFSQMRDQNVIDQDSCLIIGEVLANNGDVETWVDILGDMGARNIPIRISEYHVTLSALLLGGEIEAARGVLEMMRNNNIHPTSKTYLLFVKHYTQSGEMKEAAAVLDEMGRDSVDPEVDIYVTLMLGYMQKGDIKSAAPLVKYLSTGDRLEKYVKE